MTGLDKKEENKEPENSILEAPIERNKLPSKPDGTSPHECIELPDDMPKEMQQTIRMAMTSASMGTMRSGHPLFEKFNEEHVHKFLDYTQKDDDNEFTYRSSNRLYHIGYAILGVALFIFLVVYLVPKDKILFDQIFKMLVAFAGGLGSGYGIKSYQSRK